MDLIMKFIDDSKSYVNGFEAGRIWSEMELGNFFKHYPMHSANTEQVKLMCEYFAYSFNFEELDETWVLFDGERTDNDIRKRLSDAIKREDYELAARLRDEIKLLDL